MLKMRTLSAGLAPLYPRPTEWQSVARFGSRVPESVAAALPVAHQTESRPAVPVRYAAPVGTDTFHWKEAHLPGQPQARAQVSSLHGGGQIFGKIDELLRDAKSSVAINMYELQSPEIYPERRSEPGVPGADIQAGILERLIQLSRQGVKVLMILDNEKISNSARNASTPASGQAATRPEESFHNERTLARLEEHGVQVRRYPRHIAQKNHVKLLIVDGEHAVVGGMNWGNHSATNHDAAVYVQGPHARMVFHDVFKPDWQSTQGRLDDLPDVPVFHSPTLTSRKDRNADQVIKNKIRIWQTSGEKSVQGARNEIMEGLHRRILKSKESIVAQQFVLTHQPTRDALLTKHRQLTAQGKPGVQILVDEGLYKKFPKCRASIQKLDDHQVPIRFWKEDEEYEQKLHAKWWVFDGRHVVVGSANCSALGLESRNANSAPHISEDSDSESEDEESMGAIETEASYMPAKSNHEIAMLIKDAPQVAQAFMKQARFDFGVQGFGYTKPVSWNKPWPLRHLSWAAIQAQSNPWRRVRDAEAIEGSSSSEGSTGSVMLRNTRQRRRLDDQA